MTTYSSEQKNKHIMCWAALFFFCSAPAERGQRLCGFSNTTSLERRRHKGQTFLISATLETTIIYVPRRISLILG